MDDCRRLAELHYPAPLQGKLPLTIGFLEVVSTPAAPTASRLQQRAGRRLAQERLWSMVLWGLMGSRLRPTGSVSERPLMKEVDG